MKRIWLATAAGVAVVASTAGYVAFATTHPAAHHALHPHVRAQDQVQILHLNAEPQAAALLGRDQQGDLTATFNVVGLTPGLGHAVDLDVAGKATPIATFTDLTANDVGAAQHVTVTSTFTGAVPANAHLVVRLSTGTDAMSREPIAVSGPIAVGRAEALAAVDIDQNGVNEGPLTAIAVLDFNAKAQTLTVTVNATGLVPNTAHAAHIHAGSCQAQGAVVFMLPDFTADANGNIVHESRTVTGVTAAPDTQQWYLNLHLGDMNQILDANGNPTPAFRPLLCQNIGSGQSGN